MVVVEVIVVVIVVVVYGSSSVGIGGRRKSDGSSCSGSRLLQQVLTFTIKYYQSFIIPQQWHQQYDKIQSKNTMQQYNRVQHNTVQYNTIQ